MSPELYGPDERTVDGECSAAPVARPAPGISCQMKEGVENRGLEQVLG
jgi:hypothetical protein